MGCRVGDGPGDLPARQQRRVDARGHLPGGDRDRGLRARGRLRVVVLRRVVSHRPVELHVVGPGGQRPERVRPVGPGRGGVVREAIPCFVQGHRGPAQRRLGLRIADGAGDLPAGLQRLVDVRAQLPGDHGDLPGGRRRTVVVCEQVAARGAAVVERHRVAARRQPAQEVVAVGVGAGEEVPGGAGDVHLDAADRVGRRRIGDRSGELPAARHGGIDVRRRLAERHRHAVGQGERAASVVVLRGVRAGAAEVGRSGAGESDPIATGGQPLERVGAIRRGRGHRLRVAVRVIGRHRYAAGGVRRGRVGHRPGDLAARSQRLVDARCCRPGGDGDRAGAGQRRGAVVVLRRVAAAGAGAGPGESESEPVATGRQVTDDVVAGGVGLRGVDQVAAGVIRVDRDAGHRPMGGGVGDRARDLSTRLQRRVDAAGGGPGAYRDRGGAAGAPWPL